MINKNTQHTTSLRTIPVVEVLDTLTGETFILRKKDGDFVDYCTGASVPDWAVKTAKRVYEANNNNY